MRNKPYIINSICILLFCLFASLHFQKSFANIANSNTDTDRLGRPIETVVSPTKKVELISTFSEAVPTRKEKDTAKNIKSSAIIYQSY